jgi:hypothetical protein
MSPENSFRNKLMRTYGNNESSGVTPAQIQRFVELNGDLREISEATGIVNVSLLKEVFHPNGKLLAHKIHGCIQSVEDLRCEFGEDVDDMLEHLNPRCFRKNGRINFGRLRKNIKKASGK